MPMRMQSKAVGRQGNRRFAIAAAGAACRTTPFFYFILVLVRAGDGDTTAQESTTTSDREVRRAVFVVFFVFRFGMAGLNPKEPWVSGQSSRQRI